MNRNMAWLSQSVEDVKDRKMILDRKRGESERQYIWKEKEKESKREKERERESEKERGKERERTIKKKSNGGYTIIMNSYTLPNIMNISKNLV